MFRLSCPRWSHRSSLGTILDEAEDEEEVWQEKEAPASKCEAGGLWGQEISSGGHSRHSPVEEPGGKF